MAKDILTRSDDSEIFEYDYPYFPIYAQKERMSDYRRFRCLPHWHEDLEFHLLLEGSFTCEVNGEVMEITEGNGIWINARQLHSNYTDEGRECVFLCLLLHPSLLSATDAIALEYVSGHLNHPGITFGLLSRDVPWQKNVLDQILKIYELRSTGRSPLRIQGIFLDMWATITENTALPDFSDHKDSEKLDALKKMLRHIHNHYPEHLTLEEIAQSGNVGKSTCTEIFKAHLHDTPVNYLIQFRLEKAAELLQSTALPITEIAYNTGFSNPSYFASTFRSYYHCSPKSFRSKERTTKNR